ncbi:hypothetical protein RF11_08920 [Thelohanellus kitauei]|uniref:Uncharacterized protein n=1 Tax=Thelohanellus kitauei TaxID=669202 RepID=A0A0C2MP10_THEKT|nr:hypothetical protein RF11_08920 [Thelohanellus kitauei]
MKKDENSSPIKTHKTGITAVSRDPDIPDVTTVRRGTNNHDVIIVNKETEEQTASNVPKSLATPNKPLEKLTEKTNTNLYMSIEKINRNMIITIVAVFIISLLLLTPIIFLIKQYQIKKKLKGIRTTYVYCVEGQSVESIF